MRAASKILDETTPPPICINAEKVPRYVDQRCTTIGPNFRHAPCIRVRSPREARKRRAEGWTNCQFALPRLTLEGLRTIAIMFAQEQQQSERIKEARGYPKSLNYFVTVALNDYFRKIGFGNSASKKRKLRQTAFGALSRQIFEEVAMNDDTPVQVLTRAEYEELLASFRGEKRRS